MRLMVLEQYARGVGHHDQAEGARLLRDLERIKWWLWHGNQHRALQRAADLRDERILSAMAESTVNVVISKRFTKR